MKRLKEIFNQIRSEIEFILSYFNIGPMKCYLVSMKEYKKLDSVNLAKHAYLKSNYFGKKIRMSDYLFVSVKEYNPPYWIGGEVLLVNPNYDRLRRNDYVLLVDSEDKIRIAQVKHPGWPNLPDLFDGNETIGITHWVVGKIECKNV